MHHGVNKGEKRAGNSNRIKMPLVRFDHLAQNGVKIRPPGMSGIPRQVLLHLKVASDAFWGQMNTVKKGGKFKCEKNGQTKMVSLQLGRSKNESGNIRNMVWRVRS